MTLFRIIILLFFFTSCSSVKKDINTNTPPMPPPLPKEVKAKNIIFMIGDGMGLAQITAAMISNGYHLNFEQFQSIGLHKSYAYGDLITDSSAGATAFSIGRKTYNAAVGVGPDTIPYKTILQEAEERQLSTGLVATSTIVHATPASFIAHNKTRKDFDGIALDFLDTDIDYFVGGGRKFFANRADGKDLYTALKRKGYQIEDYLGTDLQKVKITNKKFAYLTSDQEPLPASQGRDYFEDASMMAIEHLSKNENGFFLMIEGSQIDWGGHANKTDYIVSEMLEFDKTLGRVLDWVKKDGNTLLIVTADHETGGLSINQGSTMDSLVTKFTTDYHTGVLIPVFAFGPREELFRGIYENTSIYSKMKQAFHWPDTPSEKKAWRK